jgi:5'-nucleotidase
VRRAPSRTLAGLTRLLAGAVLFGCAGAPDPGHLDLQPGRGELVIVATSDFHAALDRAEGLAHVIRALREEYGDRVLWLDGGDLFQGSFEANLNKGRSVVALFSELGLDAAAVGNHDLDYGPAGAARLTPSPGEDPIGNLRARAREARFRWLSANWIRDGSPPRSAHPHWNALGQPTVFPPHAIFQRAGRNVCVVGATTPETPHKTLPVFVKGTSFEPLAPVVLAEARALRASGRCDLVLLTMHAGLLCAGAPPDRCTKEGRRAEALELLHTLPEGTFDAVVGGHSHERAQVTLKGTPVLQAGTGAQVVGVLHLGRANRFRFEPFRRVPDRADDARVSALLLPFREEARAAKARVLGRVEAPFPRTYDDEGPLGNLIADAVLEEGRREFDATVAVVHAGQVRAGLVPGQLTYGDLHRAMPFDNAVVLVELTGAQLRVMLQIALSGQFGRAAVSGLRVRLVREALAPPGGAGARERDLDGNGRAELWERDILAGVVDDGGQPVVDDALYRVATLDYLAAGGDRQSRVFSGVDQSRVQVGGGGLTRDLVASFIAARGVIAPGAFYLPNDPRVRVLPPEPR